MLTRRLPGLDGLRGCAVSAVVLHHSGVLHRGFLGVDVFFVLSGYLITSLVTAEFGRTSTVDLPRFYARRALRLYPALVAVTAFCLGLALVSGRRVAATAHDAAVSVLYVANLFSLEGGLLDHTWTLALEEQFYLVWPAILLLTLRRSGRTRWLPAAALVAVLLVADLALGRSGPVHSYVRAMGLPLGCALALSGRSVVARIGHHGWAAALVLVAVIVLPVPNVFTTGWPVSVGAVLAVPVVAMLASRRSTWFEQRWLVWLGLRSYSLYLWHFPLLSLARHQVSASVPTPARIAGGVALSLVAAELSFRMVEQPVLRLRDRAVGPAAPAESSQLREDPWVSPGGMTHVDSLGRRTRETGVVTATGNLSIEAQARYRFIQRLLRDDLPPPARVVELGSAPGDQIARLADLGYQAVSVDIGTTGDEWGSGEHGRMERLLAEHGVENVTWDLEQMPYPLESSSFDAVIMTEVFEHLREYPVRSLEEVHRVLRPGGRLYLTTPNAAYALNRVRVLRGQSIATGLDDWIGGVPHARHAREYTFPEMRRLLEYARLEPVTLTSRHFYLDSGRTGAAARLTKLALSALAQRRPTLGPAIIAVAQKPR